MAKHLLTAKTYQRLEAELLHLEQVVLPEIAKEIGIAAQMGDLKENGDYHAKKDEYGMFNDRKNLVKSLIEGAEIAATPISDEVSVLFSDEVSVLSLVTILFDGDAPEDAEIYRIAHIEERETFPNDGIMSPFSPIGSALLGHVEGDNVQITLENGAKVSVSVIKVQN
jgi:transcription elongation factor GreA